MLRITACAAMLALLTSSASFAQEKEEETRWGIGVGLSTALGASFRVPILFEKIRVEPEIGFRTSTSHSTNGSIDSYNNVQETYSYVYSSSSETATIGVGIYYMFHIDNGLSFYCGPRGGIGYTTSTNDNSASRTYSDTTTAQSSTEHLTAHNTTFFVGGTLGSEYFLARHFSIGGEILVTYSKTGNPVVEESSTQTPRSSSVSIPSTSSNSSFGESMGIYVRWYF